MFRCNEKKFRFRATKTENGRNNLMKVHVSRNDKNDKTFMVYTFFLMLACHSSFIEEDELICFFFPFISWQIIDIQFINFTFIERTKQSKVALFFTLWIFIFIF